MNTEKANRYYNLYANQAAPVDLLKLGEDTIAKQITEINEEENEWEAAEGVLQVARETVISQARKRIDDSETLAPYTELFFADWREGDEHLVWLIEAPESELLKWGEVIAEQDDQMRRQQADHDAETA